MKILVCIPCLLNGGTEVQTLSLVEALVAAGHDPVVVCYFEHDASMVERYYRAGAEVKLLSAEGVRTNGLKDTVSHLWHGLKGIVRAERPDVAHVQYMAPGALPVVILKALGIKRIIATSHTGGDIYTANGLRTIKLLSRICLTAFQCITERAEQSFFGASHLFDGTLRRHFTIYNNLPGHISIRQQPRTELSLFAPITVGVVSRLERIKGMDLVVPAFAKAYAGNMRLRLLVVGDGSQKQLMERQVVDLQLNECVEFVGRKHQSELQDCYDGIDILLMPSRSEGFGLTAIEGMARGCVPVVADTGGLPEVVTPDCGMLHRPEDIADIADKITTLAADASLISSLSSASLRHIEIFSTDNYRQAIARLYDSM